MALACFNESLKKICSNLAADVKWPMGSSKEEEGSSLFLGACSSWSCFVYMDSVLCLHKCEIFCQMKFVGPAPPALSLLIQHPADCMSGTWARQRGHRNKFCVKHKQCPQIQRDSGKKKGM